MIKLEKFLPLSDEPVSVRRFSGAIKNQWLACELFENHLDTNRLGVHLDEMVARGRLSRAWIETANERGASVGFQLPWIPLFRFRAIVPAGNISEQT